MLASHRWSAVLGMLVTLGMAHPQPTAADPIAGEWVGPLALDRGTSTITLELHVADTTLTGTVYLDGDRFGVIERGTVRGDTVHFNVDRFDFTGIVTGHRMRVALIVYNGSTRRLTLTKRPDPPPPPRP